MMLQKCFIGWMLFHLLVFGGSAAAQADGGIAHVAAPEADQAVPDPAVQTRRSADETVYRITRDQCTIEWSVRNTEKNVILHRPYCPLSLSHQVPLLKKICAEFFGEGGHPLPTYTLYWGRLAPDGSLPDSLEMSFRLALAAHRSKGWNPGRGKPKKGGINGFIRDLANSGMIYPELKELLAPFNRSVTFSCAEKVLVMEAGKLPFYDELLPYGVRATERLPFDCMAWFTLSAK